MTDSQTKQTSGDSAKNLTSSSQNPKPKPNKDLGKDSKKKPNQNLFFLISFLPAAAYWYLEKNYDLKTALIGGIGLAILELSAEKILLKHVHTISKFNAALILILGLISLGGEDGLWFKLQPFFTGVGVGSFILIRAALKKSVMLELTDLMGSDESLPPHQILTMEKHMAIFMICYAIFMGAVALWGTTGTWLFYKTGGFYIAFALGFIAEMVYLKFFYAPPSSGA